MGRGNDNRPYHAERPRPRTRIELRIGTNARMLPYCLSEGCPYRKQTAAWCQGFCKRHARYNGFTPDPDSEDEEIAPPVIPVPSNAIQILAQILGPPGCATVEQRFSSTKEAEVDKGSHPQTPLTPQAPDKETRATIDPAASASKQEKE